MPVGDYKIGERITDPGDPERCQGMVKDNQCVLKKVEGSKFCAAHGGNKALASAKVESVSRFRLTKWQAQVERFRSDSDLKSLRDEIGILRVLLEERLNHCQTNLDLILHSGPISDLVVKIEKLVKSCHDIDKDFENLLDKTQVIQIADEIISVISEEITDEGVMNTIQSKLLNLLCKKPGELKNGHQECGFFQRCRGSDNAGASAPRRKDSIHLASYWVECCTCRRC
jgi:hypothetical protein